MTDSNYRIRFFDEKDMDVIADQLLHDLPSRARLGTRGGNVKKPFVNDNWNAVFVLEAYKGTSWGVAGYAKVSLNSTDCVVEIEQLYLFPEIRRKGLGTRFLKYLEKYGAESWFGNYYRVLTIENEAMSELLKKNGYLDCGIYVGSAYRDGHYLSVTMWQKKI